MGPTEDGFQPTGVQKANEGGKGMRKWRKPINGSPSQAHIYSYCDSQIDSSKKRKLLGEAELQRCHGEL